MKGRLLIAMCVLAGAAGCGGGEEGEEERAAEACGPAPAAMMETPDLPTGFPTPSGVTYTGQEDKGPSQVISGFRPGDIDSSFEEYKSALGSGGYNVTKDEQEEDDAEVNFAGPDSTGQVKLVQECRDRTTVTITVRPA